MCIQPRVNIVLIKFCTNYLTTHPAIHTHSHSLKKNTSSGKPNVCIKQVNKAMDIYLLDPL